MMNSAFFLFSQRRGALSANTPCDSICSLARFTLTTSGVSTMCCPRGPTSFYGAARFSAVAHEVQKKCRNDYFAETKENVGRKILPLRSREREGRRFEKGEGGRGGGESGRSSREESQREILITTRSARWL